MTMMLLLGVGCTATTTVPLGTLSDDPEVLSTQMLKPRIRLERCRWTAPFGRAAHDGLVPRTLASVPDANVLRNATLETRDLHLGLGRRTCVRLRGDATRRISEIVLPDVSGAHGGHH